MSTETRCEDVMQVCENGHVVTDMLHAFPERGVSHCDRCGATTIERCLTCGQELLGAVYIPGLVPIGRPQPPQFCSGCGASFPWTARAVKPLPTTATTMLEQLLRRLPRTIRQLRVRQGDRPAFRVNDERDLEDLLRSVLPLQFDEVRPECRTASYAPGTSTDFLLDSGTIALTVKRTRPKLGERELASQFQEDVDYYDSQRDNGTLFCFVYDPEGRLRDPRQQETMWSKSQGLWEVRCVIAT